MNSLPLYLSSSSSPARKRISRRRVIVAFVLGVGVLGLLVSWLPGRSVVTNKPLPALTDVIPSDPFASLQKSGAAGRQEASDELLHVEPKVSQDDRSAVDAKALLKKIAKTIQAKRHDEALRLLNDAREHIQKYPESYLLVARALEGKKDYNTARDFYNAALDRDPMLAEAYWGMATTSEALGDLPAALGGMRSFLHTVADPDPFRLKVAQARSAIWEWESQLGRGPWGPTKGVLWGITPEQMRKDDRGVAIMMPLPGTQQPDGSVKFEIKHQDKFEIFEKK